MAIGPDVVLFCQGFFRGFSFPFFFLHFLWVSYSDDLVTAGGYGVFFDRLYSFCFVKLDTHFPYP